MSTSCSYAPQHKDEIDTVRRQFYTGLLNNSWSEREEAAFTDKIGTKEAITEQLKSQHVKTLQAAICNGTRQEKLKALLLQSPILTAKPKSGKYNNRLPPHRHHPPQNHQH